MLTLAMGLQPLGCASETSSSPLTLQNNWLFTTADGNSGTGLTITKENTYAVVRLEASSSEPNSLYSQIETGTLAVAGSSITFTPEKWTCQEPTDPAYSATYEIHGDSLTVAFNWGVVLMKVNNATAASSPSSLILINGCFMSGGRFRKSPLTPVGSCGVAGGDCSAPDATCCNGSACTNGGTCADTCTANAQCKSGCCLGAAAGNGVCASATSCK